MSAVIINDAWCFWSGQRWVSEYPDAEEYSTENKAIKAAQKLVKTDAVKTRVLVIDRYGFENQGKPVVITKI